MPMTTVGPRFEACLRALGLLVMGLCGVGVVTALFVVLVRIPALATTRLELILGTLAGVAVCLLFAVVAFLMALTLMLRRALRPLATILVPNPAA